MRRPLRSLPDKDPNVNATSLENNTMENGIVVKDEQTQNPRCRLLELPGEIRNIILEMAVAPGPILMPAKQPSPSEDRTVVRKVLGLCRAVLLPARQPSLPEDSIVTRNKPPPSDLGLGIMAANKQLYQGQYSLIFQSSLHLIIPRTWGR